MNSQEVEVGWAAGFFDGEGTAYASRNREGRSYLVFTASQAEREPLERLQRLVGGRLYRKTPRKNDLSSREIWTLHVAKRAEVALFLELVYPHLCSIKRLQTDRARALELANPAPIPQSKRNYRRALVAVGE